MTYWLKRCALALAIAVVAWIGLSLLSYLLFCGLVGPWGGALDARDESHQPAIANELVWLHRAALVIGSLLIGWYRSKRMSGRPPATTDQA
jgi:hypothetical protein